MLTWVGGMIAELERAGVQSMVSLEMLTTQYMATADMLLPERIRLTPPVASAAMTTIVVAQRWKHREAVARHTAAQDATGRMPPPIPTPSAPAPPTSAPVADSAPVIPVPQHEEYVQQSEAF